mmetsp:Transcript_144348/g.462425  ORF Transcript_144348/g.462425 Transcript_144348/m.462425 type:complete len:260 (-) Transcript_144348:34-813(-)
MLEDGIDERLKDLPVDARGVELVWGEVRGGDHDAPRFEEPLEEGAHEQGVTDVQHVALVETEQRRLLHEGLRHERHGVADAAELLADAVQLAAHVQHEIVKVGAAARQTALLDSRVEHVHHHRLARARIAIHINTSRGPRGRARAQGRKIANQLLEADQARYLSLSVANSARSHIFLIFLQQVSARGCESPARLQRHSSFEERSAWERAKGPGSRNRRIAMRQPCAGRGHTRQTLPRCAHRWARESASNRGLSGKPGGA